MKRNANKTSIPQIVDYWSGIVDEGDLSVDWSEAEERCWRCGSAKELTRCHIVPHSLGGDDEPANYVMLCRQCHEEGPNVNDPEIMWDWLMAYKCTYYDTFWQVEGKREYERIYRRTTSQDLQFLTEECAVCEAEFEDAIRDAVHQSSRHFGQSAPNKATTAGIYRMVMKVLAERAGKKLPDERRPSHTRKCNPRFWA